MNWLPRSRKLGKGTLTETVDLLNAAVPLLIKAALLAARFSRRVRRRSLKQLAALDTDAKAKETSSSKTESRFIPAWYPNHIWSIDTTKVWCWGLWSIQVLGAIDHFSRKVVCVVPLEGPNAGWIIEALEQAMRKHGAPKHIISEQAKVFVGDAFAELLDQWDRKPSCGAVGKHGSIAATEQVIKTLKYEWLRCVPIVKGYDHLTLLCTEFERWYNAWRPHMALEGLRPEDLYYDRKPEKPTRHSKPFPAISNVMSLPKRGSRRIASRTRRSLCCAASAFDIRTESAIVSKAE